MRIFFVLAGTALLVLGLGTAVGVIVRWEHLALVTTLFLGVVSLYCILEGVNCLFKARDH